MGLDRLSSTPGVAAGAAVDKGLAMLVLEKFRLLSMFIPCSLFIPTAAIRGRGALY
jgi:hypothetical protein